jgi:hypothetical protein
MKNAGDVFNEMIKLHSEFSLKVGRKNDNVVAEVTIAGTRAGVAFGENVANVLVEAHGQAVMNLAHKLLAESRLEEATFDRAISDDEDGCCCGCDSCHHEDYDEEEEEDF